MLITGADDDHCPPEKFAAKIALEFVNRDLYNPNTISCNFTNLMIPTGTPVYCKSILQNLDGSYNPEGTYFWATNAMTFTLANASAMTFFLWPQQGWSAGALNSVFESIRATNATFTASVNDAVLLCSGTITATLPTAASVAGKTYTIKNTGSGTVTVGTTSSQNIDGATTKSLPTQYDSITVVSDGAQWWIIREYGTGLTL